jgi:two-component system nitrate/nitrite sensor histidine kinase NarX
LAEADLDDLLRQLAEATRGKARVAVEVDVQGACTLPRDVHVTLYRIAQEALNNVARHARASRVGVQLRCQPHGATLSISDDGRGFDGARVPPGHLGIGIMRERAEAIGAQLEIESQAGQGTRVTVTWEGGRMTSDE